MSYYIVVLTIDKKYHFTGSVDIYRSRYSFDICHLRNANMYFLFLTFQYL